MLLYFSLSYSSEPPYVHRVLVSCHTGHTGCPRPCFSILSAVLRFFPPAGAEINTNTCKTNRVLVKWKDRPAEGWVTHP